MSPFQIDFGEQKSPVIGIDLGTTNSLVSVIGPAGQPEIIPGPLGQRILPSIVSIHPDGRVIVGDEACQALITHPDRSVYSAKRLMGRGRADIAAEIERFPFRLTSNSDSVIELQLGERAMTPPQIGAEVLRELKAWAEAHLGQAVFQAVITVPAYFNDAQRQATKDAGRIAGLEVLRLVNEPTAASLAYGLDKRKEGIIAVYDLGGGTFDISILRLRDGIFEVLATNGDTHLGGDDVDNLLLAIALEDLASEWGGDWAQRPEIVQGLRFAVIKAKEALSFAPSASIDFAVGGNSYQREISREQFEQLIAPFVDRTLGPCRQCLKDASVTVEEIAEVVLVGGSTRIPLVRKAVENLFRSKPHTELNPDEVVALGAAVQAGILSGDVQDTLLLDVTPLSLGIETMGGVVSRLIHRNSTIPASATEQYTTGVDGQTNVLINVVQGERELVKDCRALARFDFKGIDPMPAGFARIEVRFLIDANGILNVSARDARTGKEQSVEVTPSYGLTSDQVEAMIKESFDKAEDDLRERQVREARVEADTILTATEKAREHEAWESLSTEEQQQVDRGVAALQAVYHSPDYNAIRDAIEVLNQATSSLAENMMNTAVRGALKGTKV